MEVARCQGVSKAAAKLSLTPSAVSQSLKALEEAFELRLFDRVGKQMSLTAEGKTLYQNLLHYQSGLELALNAIKAQSAKVKGRVRLGIFNGFSVPLSAKFLAKLKVECPDLEVDVIYGAPSELNRQLLYRKIDLAINLFSSKDEPRIKELPLAKDELWLVSSKSPPRRSLSLSELKEAPFIDYYRSSHLIPAWIAHHFGKKVREIPIAMFAAHSDMVLQLILEGAGIGIVPSSLARPYVEQRKLFVIRKSSKQLESQIWLKELKTSSESAARLKVKENLLASLSEI